jgi:hypothetical protein
MQNFERYGAGAGPELVGKLVKFTSLGCYPVFYLDTENSVLCADCANADEQNADDPKSPVACDANWEDPCLHCDNCSARIESAYAEDSAES